MLDAVLRATEGERIVACIDGRSVSASELGARAAAVASALKSSGRESATSTALAFDRDRVAFAAALLGSWSAGRAATLLTDARREIVTSIARHPSTGVLLHDCGAGRGVYVPSLLQDSARAESTRRATLSTSGTTLSSFGTRPCRVSFGTDEPAPPGLPGFELHSWTARDLDLELERLARELRWSASGPVVSTLTPSSLPGALLGVLLPLATERPFSSAVPRSPEEIAHVVMLQRARTLVTTPAHIIGLRDLPRGALAGLECIVSTWEELGADLRRELEQRHDLEVHVVLGPADVSDDRGAARGLREVLSRLAGVVDAEVARGPEGLLAIVTAPDRDAHKLLDELRALPVEPPSRFRVVERIERDPDGAVRAADVLRRFDLDHDGRPIRLDFDWSPTRALEPGVFEVRVPEDSAWFEGHFPGRPLLAGAVQLQELVLPALRKALPESTRITAWSGLKFVAPIHPGDPLSVTLVVDKSRGLADFVVRRGEERCSLGRVRFDACDARHASPSEREA